MIQSLIALAVVLSPAMVLDGEPLTFDSPDKALQAKVIPIGQRSFGGGESRIEIRGTNGRRIYSISYSSPDGEHGWNVVHAAWTPDSKFFVYSLQSSGGHQAWHSPIKFYCRLDNKLRSLDKRLGPVTDPKFSIEAPDIILASGQRKEDLEATTFRTSLSNFLHR